MTIEIANRLVELRKKSGLSQEELADKLGLSRQAVSKWERAEASPDTDNLICLAKLYNVSLDDLLNTDLSVDEIARNTKEQEENKKSKIIIEANDDDDDDDDDDNRHPHHIHVVRPEKEEYKNRIKLIRKIELITSAILLLAIVGGYIALAIIGGEIIGKEHEFFTKWFWLNFLLIPVIQSVFECIAKRKFSNFLIPFACAYAYVVIGLLTDTWSPTWLIFISIPVYYVATGFIDRATKEYRDEKRYL